MGAEDTQAPTHAVMSQYPLGIGADGVGAARGGVMVADQMIPQVNVTNEDNQLIQVHFILKTWSNNK